MALLNIFFVQNCIGFEKTGNRRRSGLDMTGVPMYVELCQKILRRGHILLKLKVPTHFTVSLQRYIFDAGTYLASCQMEQWKSFTGTKAFFMRRK